MSLQLQLPLDGNIKQQGISNIEMIETPTSWDSNGKILDFRMYTTALSGEDIKELY